MSKNNFDQFKYCIVSEFCYGCEIVSNKLPCVPHMNVIDKKVFLFNFYQPSEKDKETSAVNLSILAFNTHVLGLNL